MAFRKSHRISLVCILVSSIFGCSSEDYLGEYAKIGNWTVTVTQSDETLAKDECSALYVVNHIQGERGSFEHAIGDNPTFHGNGTFVPVTINQLGFQYKIFDTVTTSNGVSNPDTELFFGGDLAPKAMGWRDLKLVSIDYEKSMRLPIKYDQVNPKQTFKFDLILGAKWGNYVNNTSPNDTIGGVELLTFNRADINLMDANSKIIPGSYSVPEVSYACGHVYTLDIYNSADTGKIPSGITLLPNANTFSNHELYPVFHGNYDNGPNPVRFYYSH